MRSQIFLNPSSPVHCICCKCLKRIFKIDSCKMISTYLLWQIYGMWMFVYIIITDNWCDMCDWSEQLETTGWVSAALAWTESARQMWPTHLHVINFPCTRKVTRTCGLITCLPANQNVVWTYVIHILRNVIMAVNKIAEECWSDMASSHRFIIVYN